MKTDEITKAALSPQLFKRPLVNNGPVRIWTHDLPRTSPMLNQLSQSVGDFWGMGPPIAVSYP